MDRDQHDPETIRTVLERLSLHAKVAAEAYPRGGILQCVVCRETQDFKGKQAGHYMERGWPAHCGETMVVIFDKADEGHVARSVLDRLTKRQCEVAELVRRGLNNREIGAALFLSDQTVASHLQGIYRRTGLAGRGALAARLDRERARVQVAAAAGDVEAART